MESLKRSNWYLWYMVVLLLFSGELAGQPSEVIASGSKENFNLAIWFGLLEFPFLILCIFYCFKTSAVLRGGIFGKGMKYLAWGFVVMAVGHIAMQIHHICGFDVFRDVLGHLFGSLLWFVALSITWGLSAIGFYRIYTASMFEKI